MSGVGTPPPRGSTRRLIDQAQRTARRLHELDVDAGLWAVDLDTGHELGFAGDEVFPLASVIKVPIGLVVADLCASGELDPSEPITLRAEQRGPGPFGISALTYPVTMSIADLARQMISLSDNAAADALLDRISVGTVADTLQRWNVTGISIRQHLRTMYECATRIAGDDFALATQLAVAGGRPDGTHPIESLDLHRANVGSARDCVGLLARIWADAVATPAACSFVRAAMERQVFTHRLGTDLRADDVTIAGKTGTFLHLRHEIGVITHHTTRVAMAALTASRRTARIRADVDLAIGHAARDWFEALRSASCDDDTAGPWHDAG